MSYWQRGCYSCEISRTIIYQMLKTVSTISMLLIYIFSLQESSLQESLDLSTSMILAVVIIILLYIAVSCNRGD